MSISYRRTNLVSSTGQQKIDLEVNNKEMQYDLQPQSVRE